MWLIGGFLSGVAHSRWKDRQEERKPNSAGDTVSFMLRAFVRIMAVIFALCVVAVIWTTFSEPHKENVHKEAWHCVNSKYGYEESNLNWVNPADYPLCGAKLVRFQRSQCDPFPGWWPSFAKMNMDCKDPDRPGHGY